METSAIFISASNRSANKTIPPYVSFICKLLLQHSSAVFARIILFAVCAAEVDGFSAVPYDAWDGGSAQFTGKDGSVTTVYDSGSVVTEYPDGRTFGVDYLGNQHSKDKDGTYTVTGKNGDVARENPDGTQELTEANGKKLVQNPDGSGKTVYPSGLVIEHNSEHTPHRCLL